MSNGRSKMKLRIAMSYRACVEKIIGICSLTIRGIGNFLLEKYVLLCSVIALVILMIGMIAFGFFVKQNWEWLAPESSQYGNAETIGIVVAVAGAPIFLLLSIWRNYTARSQLKIDSTGRMNQRYEKGVELIGMDGSWSKMSGITILGNLSREHPREYTMLVMESLADFIRGYSWLAESRNGGTAAKSRQRKRGTNDVNRLEKDKALVNRAISIISTRTKREVNYCRRRSPHRRINLSECNLSFVNFLHINMTDINLSRSDISETRIIGCDFTESVFQFASLKNAVIDRTRFKNSRLVGTIFLNSDVSFCNFEATTVDYVRFDFGNLSFSKFMKSRGICASFKSSHIHNSDISDVDIKLSEFQKADIGEVEIINSQMAFCDFTGATLYDVDLTNSDFTNASLQGARFENVDLINVNLSGANLCGAKFIESDFSGAILEFADLRGAVFQNVLGLTQNQLDQACQSQGTAPKFTFPSVPSVDYEWDKKSAELRYDEFKVQMQPRYRMDRKKLGIRVTL